MCGDENVPSYVDLGKCARDVYATGFNFGKGKINITHPYLGGRFVADTTADLKKLTEDVQNVNLTSEIFGKYHIENYGCVSAKYGWKGPIVMEYNSVPIGIEAFSIGASYAVNPENSLHSGKIKGFYECPKINSSITLSKEGNQGPEILSNLVVKVKNFFLGFQTGYSWNTRSVTKSDVGLYTEYGKAAFHFRCIRIPHEFGLSTYYHVNDDLRLAMNGIVATNWGSEQQRVAWSLGAALKYRLDANSHLRLKIDNDCQFAASLQFRMLQGLRVTLAFGIDALRPLTGQSKVGIGLDLTY